MRDFHFRRNIKHSILLGLVLLLLTACSQKSEFKPGSLSFYHWQTQFEVGQNGRNLMKEAHSKALYVRFFDVYYDREKQRPFPKATVQVEEMDSLPLENIVPVVYITNEVFRHENDSESIQGLAENTADKIDRLSKKFPAVKIKEIQFDCDWTLKTRDAYFEFLKSFRKLYAEGKERNSALETPLRLSATIRLHQVKYKEKTGVPPVDEAVIMCYNVGDLGDENEENSILNVNKTVKYLTRLKDYPLPFKIALPYFGWGVLYRDGQLKGILNELTPEKLQQNFKLEKGNTYIAKKESYLEKIFINKGETLRWEQVDLKNLTKLKTKIDEFYPDPYPVILYRLNSPQLKTVTHEKLFDLFK